MPNTNKRHDGNNRQPDGATRKGHRRDKATQQAATRYFMSGAAGNHPTAGDLNHPHLNRPINFGRLTEFNPTAAAN